MSDSTTPHDIISDAMLYRHRDHPQRRYLVNLSMVSRRLHSILSCHRDPAMVTVVATLRSCPHDVIPPWVCGWLTLSRSLHGRHCRNPYTAVVTLVVAIQLTASCGRVVIISSSASLSIRSASSSIGSASARVQPQPVLSGCHRLSLSPCCGVVIIG